MEFNVFVENGKVYREGGMRGKWFELPMTEDELVEAFAEIGVEYSENLVLNRDYTITDYENECNFEVGDYEPIELLNDIADRLDHVQDMVWLQAYMDETGESLDEAMDRYEDNSVFYPNCDLVDLAYQIVNDDYELEEFARRYFDYEAFARDLGYDGYVEYEGGVLYVY